MNYTNRPKNWLITGGCGFIGTALICSILQEIPGVRIRVLDNLSGGSREDLAVACQFMEISRDRISSGACCSESLDQSCVELLVGDIEDANFTRDAAKGMDCIVHLAANTGVAPSVQDPVKDMESNVQGTLNMLEAARNNKVSRFIFSSSSAPVGETEPPVHEEIAPHPLSPYGASKLAGEGYCSAYYHSFGVQTAVLRFGNVYGPGSTHKSSVVAKFIKQALRGETCVIYGDGFQTRDFIYIDDLVRAILRAGLYDPPSSRNFKLSSSCSDLPSNKSPWGEIFQIATNREHTVREMAKKLAEELARHGVDMYLKHGEPMRGDIRRNYSDTSKANDILGWDCSTNLQEGLAQTVKWFLSETNEGRNNT